jgi:replicative DNA helicase
LRSSNHYYLDVIARRQAANDDPKLKFHCWPGLSKLMPELGIGDLVAVLAESGVGKTVFLEQCAEDWARRGWRVAFFHLELNSQTMLDRRMTRHTGIPIANLRDELSDAHFNQIIKVCGEIDDWTGNIHYVHCPGWTSEQIISKAIELDETSGIDIVIVDYFNKIRTVAADGMNYAQARGYDVETIKNGVEVYGWRGLMAAQFDKAATYKPKKRGSDARDTGELEQKANVVMVIDRQIGENNQREKCGQVQVVKCNAGREGSIDVVYQGEVLTYGELSTRLGPGDYPNGNGKEKNFGANGYRPPMAAKA